MKLYYLFFLTLVASINAKIIEAHHFEEIVAHAAADTLIVLDIDDTLLIPAQMLGCDEWFLKKNSQHLNEGMSKKDALEKTISEWESIRHLTKMKLVEEKTNEIVNALQKKGCTIMGLTTQGLGLATRTVQQLQEHQIDLSLNAPTKEEWLFPNSNHSVLFRKGILFTSGTDKGEALFTLCNLIGFHPQKILFINDKESHLLDVEKSALPRNIQFLGLRYAYADHHKKAFSYEIAEYQFYNSTFGHILSDDEATNLMSNY